MKPDFEKIWNDATETSSYIHPEFLKSNAGKKVLLVMKEAWNLAVDKCLESVENPGTAYKQILKNKID